jgi:hypothetical protein
MAIKESLAGMDAIPRGGATGSNAASKSPRIATQHQRQPLQHSATASAPHSMHCAQRERERETSASPSVRTIALCINAANRRRQARKGGLVTANLPRKSPRSSGLLREAQIRQRQQGSLDAHPSMLLSIARVCRLLMEMVAGWLSVCRSSGSGHDLQSPVNRQTAFRIPIG